MEEQSQMNKAEEKTNDKINNLEKLMKLERKSISFDFRDQSLKQEIQILDLINFQLRITQPKADNYSGTADYQLKMFWRLIENHYFRKIEQSELDRLEYLRLLTQSFPKSFNKFQASKQFWELLENTYQPRAYKSILQSKDQLQRKNFLELIYEYTNLADGNQLPKNKIKDKLKELNKIKVSPLQNKKSVNLKSLLEAQSKQLANYRAKYDTKQQNQLDQEIAELEQQLSDVRQFNKYSYENIVKRVKKERLHRHRFYFANTDEQFENIDKMLSSKKTSIFPNYFQTNEELNCLTEFLKYIIHRVQMAQIAESMAKVLNCENRNGKYFFYVEFEKGTNIKDRYMEQKQILQYDKLRDVSIFKNYKMSINQHQFVISNNIAGFYDYYHQKITKNDYIQKDYLLNLKKNISKYTKDKAYDEFVDREICHQCKCLFPKSWIMGCKYTSTKQGNPAVPYSYYDPYLDELTKLSVNNNQRFSTRKLNSCNGYTKINDQYVCERQYCKHCLENLYPTRQQEDLCPFCEGICSCTRCSRNQRLIKLKTLYHLYGGDMNDLKPIQFLTNSEDESVENRNNKRGRPKKTKLIQKQPKKIKKGSFFKQKFQQNLRQGLEDARTLAGYVKRRQVKKQILYEKMHKLFQMKANIVSQQSKKSSKTRQIYDENEMPNTSHMRGKKRIH